VKAVRRNYRFDAVTWFNLQQLQELTGESETKIVEDAIAYYYKSQLRVQELLDETRREMGI